jgi:predicted CXXCH cytochrome family protein
MVCLSALPVLFAAATPPGYVEPSACAQCHAQIAQTFSRTGMARSFQPAAASSLSSRLQSLNLDHQPSGQHFTARRTDGQYSVRRTGTTGREQTVGAFEQGVDYVIGSGDHAANFLHRTADGQLIELPVTWYTSEGSWGMSPGYDRPDHLGFSRAITYRCLFCHNAYPDVPEGAANWDGETVLPSDLAAGIDCQRCHGPGAAHIAAARGGKSAREIQAAIVSPARLTPERQLEICMQCHLETTTTALPGSILRFGRPVFSYRPGQPLADYILYFDHAPDTGNDDKFEFVSAPYRLRKSACFTATGGRLTCTVCHDPHVEPSRAEALRKTDTACLDCHQQRSAGHPQSTECVSCHMPRRVGEDAIHIPVTDHWIQRPPKTPAAAPSVERTDSNTVPYAGVVAPYYPNLPDPIYTAIAQVSGFATPAKGLPNLARLLTETHPADGQPYFELAEALLTVGQPARALPLYQQAAKIDAQNWRYLFGLAQAQKALGTAGRGVAEMEQAIALAPQVTSLRNALGVIYAMAGRPGDALLTLRGAVARNPEDSTAHNNLGQALMQTGDARGAIAEFREAVRIRPEMVELRTNLADALMQTGQFREAANQMEEVLRVGPSTVEARNAWFRSIAATGNVNEAHAQYDRALRQQTAGFHDNLGTALISLGDADGAIREYRAAFQADPRSATAALNLGLTLAAKKQPEEARRWLVESLRLNPNQPDGHLQLGALLLAAGQREEALIHLRVAAASSDSRIRQEAERLLGGAK